MDGIGGNTPDSGGDHHHAPNQRKRTHSAMIDGERTTHDTETPTSVPAPGQNLQSGSSSHSLFIPQDDHYNNEHDSRRLRLVLPPLPARFPRDGLDFRTPAINAVDRGAWIRRSSPYIDLTADDETQHPAPISDAPRPASGPLRAQRLPRFDRDIIDLVSDDVGSNLSNGTLDAALRAPSRSREDGRPQYSGLRRAGRPAHVIGSANTDEVEVVAARSLSHSRATTRGPASTAGRGPRSVTPYPSTYELDTIDLTEDDDVVFTTSRRREGGINAEPPSVTGGIGVQSVSDVPSRAFDLFSYFTAEMPRLTQRLLGSTRFDQQRFATHHRHHHHHHHHHHSHDPAAAISEHSRRFGTLFAPPLLDFNAVGFDLRHPGGRGSRERVPSPKYSPPPDAASGFTRTPVEDEEVVCPNCGAELAIGPTEEKQQIWVVKSCGHAYCGDCARHRSRSTSKKGKDRSTDDRLPPPFKKCVVEGCEKSTMGPKAMIHVFMGS